MNMLQNCPAATQHIIAKEMAKMVVDSIKKEEDLEELFFHVTDNEKEEEK